MCVCCSKPKLVVSCLLAGSVVREAMDILETEGRDDAPWPRWYSLPLLSRTVYILGNLTTTNERNRVALGAHSGFLRCLNVLLEVSASPFLPHATLWCMY